MPKRCTARSAKTWCRRCGYRWYRKSRWLRTRACTGLRGLWLRCDMWPWTRVCAGPSIPLAANATMRRPLDMRPAEVRPNVRPGTNWHVLKLLAYFWVPWPCVLFRAVTTLDGPLSSKERNEITLFVILRFNSFRGPNFVVYSRKRKSCPLITKSVPCPVDLFIYSFVWNTLRAKKALQRGVVTKNETQMFSKMQLYDIHWVEVPNYTLLDSRLHNK